AAADRKHASPANAHATAIAIANRRTSATTAGNSAAAAITCVASITLSAADSAGSANPADSGNRNALAHSAAACGAIHIASAAASPGLVRRITDPSRSLCVDVTGLTVIAHRAHPAQNKTPAAMRALLKDTVRSTCAVWEPV